MGLLSSISLFGIYGGQVLHKFQFALLRTQHLDKLLLHPLILTYSRQELGFFHEHKLRAILL